MNDLRNTMDKNDESRASAELKFERVPQVKFNEGRKACIVQAIQADSLPSGALYRIHSEVTASAHFAQCFADEQRGDPVGQANLGGQQTDAVRESGAEAARQSQPRSHLPADTSYRPPREPFSF